MSSKAAYLQKYLSGNTSADDNDDKKRKKKKKEKKKKKKKRKIVTTTQFVDHDDASWQNQASAPHAVETTIPYHTNTNRQQTPFGNDTNLNQKVPSLVSSAQPDLDNRLDSDDEDDEVEMQRSSQLPKEEAEEGDLAVRLDSDDDEEENNGKEENNEQVQEKTMVTTKNNNEPQYDSDGDLILPSQSNVPEQSLSVPRTSEQPQYDSDGDLILPSQSNVPQQSLSVPRTSEQPQYDSDGDLILPSQSNVPQQSLSVPRTSEQPQYDSDGDLILPSQSNVPQQSLSVPRTSEQPQYDSDGDLILPSQSIVPQQSTSTSTGLQNEEHMKNKGSSAKGVVAKTSSVQETSPPSLDELMGRGASTVFRSKDGTVRDLEEEKRKQIEYLKRRKEIEDTEKIMFQSGKVQRQRQREKKVQDKKKIDTPFHVKDMDSEKNAMQEIREDEDPMAVMMVEKKRKKKKKKRKKALRKRERNGDVTSSQTEIDRPEYRGPPGPPNRFSIRPGYRWDGIDRGNGFEQRLINRSTAKQHYENVGYKYSTSDM
eukprot:g655.t1